MKFYDIIFIIKFLIWLILSCIWNYNLLKQLRGDIMGLDAKVVENLEKELAKNTEILESIVSKFNIKILNIAYSASLGSGNIDTYIEFVSLDGSDKIKNANVDKYCPENANINFKINFYKENSLLYSTEGYYKISKFSGYDTIRVSAGYVHLIEYATSARIFITK